VRPRDLEIGLWSELTGLGALVLSYLFAALCRRAMELDVESMGLRPEGIRIRPEADYWHKVTTTFGPRSPSPPSPTGTTAEGVAR